MLDILLVLRAKWPAKVTDRRRWLLGASPGGLPGLPAGEATPSRQATTSGGRIRYTPIHFPNYRRQSTPHHRYIIEFGYWHQEELDVKDTDIIYVNRSLFVFLWMAAWEGQLTSCDTLAIFPRVSPLMLGADILNGSVGILSKKDTVRIHLKHQRSENIILILALAIVFINYIIKR